MKNIVFLDIDGVLNNRTSMYLATRKVHAPNKCPIYTMDKGCVELFKLLLLDTNSKFVISSSWRKDTVAKSKNVFVALAWCGFTDAKKYCVGVTPRLNIVHKSVDSDEPFGRGAEVDWWLERNPVDNYVILDDDSWDIHQKDHFVKTEHEVGLTVQDMVAARKILGLLDK